MKKTNDETKRGRETPVLHQNYNGAKHKPRYLKKYKILPARPCKFCGAKPSDLVVYDMPLKGGGKCRVTRCTVCDNLNRVGRFSQA